MPFDWREYLNLAKNLGGLGSTGYSQEAADRSAVSRAYYAAFCWARNYAEQLLDFERSGTAKDHKCLRKCLQQRGKTEIASGLNQLRGWRNVCDYDDQVPELRQQVVHAIKIAAKLIQRCR